MTAKAYSKHTPKPTGMRFVKVWPCSPPGAALPAVHRAPSCPAQPGSAKRKNVFATWVHARSEVTH